MSLYQYGDDFYSYQQIGSLASARAVAPLVLGHLKAGSILDVGCGAGAWMAAYIEAGVSDVVGVDGGYVRQEQLLVNASRFRATDVGRPFDLGRQFDVVQCLEVAEHLDPSAGATLVDNLVAHAPIVLFSAAPPGQGGEHHVNERPYGFWRDLFEARGYGLFDFLRPRIQDRSEIEPWYRYNMLVFVRQDAARSLDPLVASSRIHPGDPVPDFAPIGWRLRRRILSVLSPRFVTRMAAVKHRMVLGRHVAKTRH